MLDTTEVLPILRFAKSAIEDKVASEQAGRLQYMDVVNVYVRAPGDVKTEFIDIAECVGYDITEAKVKVERPHTILREVEGELKDVEEVALVEETKKYYQKKIITPWLDKQRERLHNKKITQRYFDYCKESFERFKNNEDQPIDGTPLAMWSGAPESVKKAAIESGILSVEAAAEMTTEAMSSIGMGAADLKNSAKAFLTANVDSHQAAAQIRILEEQNADKDERLSTLEKKLAELEAA